MTAAPYQRPGLALAEPAQVLATQQIAASALHDVLAAREAPVHYVPWARQSGAAWLTVDPVDHELAVYRLTDADVTLANAAGHGEELPWLAVRTQRPVPPALALSAWDDTRYDLLAVEGVYRADDPGLSPRIEFLYWGQLHDGMGGGRTPLSVVAARLGGDLVWPRHLPPRPGREQPPLGFEMVLAAQQASASRAANTASWGPSIAPAPTAGLGVTVTAEAPPRATTGVAGPLIVAAACATAGYLVWGALRPVHRSNRRRR